MTDDKKSQPVSLDDIGERLERGREAAGMNKKPASENNTRAMGDGFRMAIELVVSVVVGTALGYFIGDWAGQRAIGVVVGLVIGFAAGMRTVYRFTMANAAAMDAAAKEQEETTANGRDDH